MEKKGKIDSLVEHVQNGPGEIIFFHCTKVFHLEICPGKFYSTFSTGLWCFYQTFLTHSVHPSKRNHRKTHFVRQFNFHLYREFGNPIAEFVKEIFDKRNEPTVSFFDTLCTVLFVDSERALFLSLF